MFQRALARRYSSYLSVLLVLSSLACGLIADVFQPQATPTGRIGLVAPTADVIATDVARAKAVAATLTADASSASRPTTSPNVSPSAGQPTTSPAGMPTQSTSTNTPIAAPSELYNLVLRYSKNCLGVQGTVAAEITCNQANPLWNLPAGMPGGYFQVQLQNSGNCLSATSKNDTDPFGLRSCNGEDAQLWRKKPSGGYFQLVNKSLLAAENVNPCVDARQWNQPLMQWPCKPWQEDDQLDNQLFCQTTANNVAACTPPPGVYVTSLQQDPPPYSDPDKPNTFHVFFRVTFSNTTGAAQSYTWFVRTFGTNGGQTPQQTMTIPPGTSTVSVGPWNIGRTCSSFTAKAQWLRASDKLQFTFKDPDAREVSLPFQVCKP